MTNNPYLKLTHQTIGEYRIGDVMLDSSILDDTLEEFKKLSASFNGRIGQNSLSVETLCSRLGSIATSVDNLDLSVDDLYLSANAISTLAVSVSDAIARLDAHDEDIVYLSGVLSTLNLKALRHAIADVGVLKPEEANQLYLKVTVFNSPEMSAPLGTIDMKDSNDWKYFKSLLVNNGSNGSGSDIDPSMPDYFPGTQWIDPQSLDTAIKAYSGTTAGFTGYGSAFNNAPVNISFLKWLDDKSLSSDLDPSSRFYLRYQWYYITEDGSEHQSDHYSMVVPSFVETGAKAANAASKSEMQALKQALEMDVVVSKFISQNEVDDADGATSIGLLAYPSVGFYANPFQCTVLDGFSTSKKIINLQSYSEAKTYKLKFTTGSSQVSIGTRPSTTTLTFYGNHGNGLEKIDELNSISMAFNANKTYLVAVNLGMIQVLAMR